MEVTTDHSLEGRRHARRVARLDKGWSVRSDQMGLEKFNLKDPYIAQLLKEKQEKIKEELKRKQQLLAPIRLNAEKKKKRKKEKLAQLVKEKSEHELQPIVTKEKTKESIRERSVQELQPVVVKGKTRQCIGERSLHELQLIGVKEQTKENFQEETKIKQVEYEEEERVPTPAIPKAILHNDEAVLLAYEVARLYAEMKSLIRDHEEINDAHSQVADDVDFATWSLERRLGRAQFIWKIDNFKEKYDQAKNGETPTIHSPCFKTHAYGYSVSLNMCPYGDSKVKGKFLSLFFCIMKGTHDPLLPWPFQYKIKFAIEPQFVFDLYELEDMVSKKQGKENGEDGVIPQYKESSSLSVGRDNTTENGLDDEKAQRIGTNQDTDEDHQLNQGGNDAENSAVKNDKPEGATDANGLTEEGLGKRALEDNQQSSNAESEPRETGDPDEPTANQGNANDAAADKSDAGPERDRLNGSNDDSKQRNNEESAANGKDGNTDDKKGKQGDSQNSNKHGNKDDEQENNQTDDNNNSNNNNNGDKNKKDEHNKKQNADANADATGENAGDQSNDAENSSERNDANAVGEGGSVDRKVEQSSANDVKEETDSNKETGITATERVEMKQESGEKDDKVRDAAATNENDEQDAEDAPVLAKDNINNVSHKKDKEISEDIKRETTGGSRGKAKRPRSSKRPKSSKKPNFMHSLQDSHVMEFVPDLNDKKALKYFQRPKLARNPCLGFPSFISLEKLWSGGFVQNDTLFVKVTVDLNDIPLLDPADSDSGSHS